MTVENDRTLSRTWQRLLLGLVAVVTVAGALQVAGVDVIGWLRDLRESILQVPPHLILAALLVRTIESLLTSLSWRNVLQATYPDTTIPYRAILGGYQGGLGLNQLAPAQSGTIVTLGLFRVIFPGSRVTTLAATYVVHQLAFIIYSVLGFFILIAVQPDVRAAMLDSLRRIVDAVSGRPGAVLIAIIALIVAVVLGSLFARSRILDFLNQAGSALAILRTPRHYIRRVLLPATGAFLCRWIVTGTLVAAFAIPLTAMTLLLILASNTLAGLIQFTPGGLGTKQALKVVVLRDYAPADVVTAYSLTQDLLLMAFNIVFALITMAWAFGWSRTRTFIREHRKFATDEHAPAPDDGTR